MKDFGYKLLINDELLEECDKLCKKVRFHNYFFIKNREEAQQLYDEWGKCEPLHKIWKYLIGHFYINDDGDYSLKVREKLQGEFLELNNYIKSVLKKQKMRSDDTEEFSPKIVFTIGVLRSATKEGIGEGQRLVFALKRWPLKEPI